MLHSTTHAGMDGQAELTSAVDHHDVTPLMLACQAYVPGANVAVIRYLVEKGSADPVKQDSEGRDSYDYCPPIDSQYVRAVLRSASGTAR